MPSSVKISEYGIDTLLSFQCNLLIYDRITRVGVPCRIPVVMKFRPTKVVRGCGRRGLLVTSAATITAGCFDSRERNGVRFSQLCQGRVGAWILLIGNSSLVSGPLFVAELP